MQPLILVMIVVATTFDYLAKGDRMGRFAMLPQQASWIGEVLGGIALLYVVAAGTQNRFQYVRPAYWFAFGTLVFIMAGGIVLNQVEAGPFFAGLRTYLRAIPWFFVGAVVAFAEQDLKRQMMLLLMIALIQLPLAIEQRMHGFGGEMGFVSYTGDSTTGTFMVSSMLSLYLICATCMLVALFVRRRLATWQFVLLFPVLLTPTLINETKGTLVFLPIGLIATYLAAADPRRRLRALLTAAGLTMLVGAAFVPVYDSFRGESQPGIMEYLTNPEVTENALLRDVQIGSINVRPAGRIDAIVVPLRHLASDPVRLAFGYGIGNVSNSSLGTQFVGKQYPKFSLFMVHAFARITLELGVLGLVLVLVLMWLVFVDALKVARLDNGLYGVIAAGMVGVVSIIVVSLVYVDLIILISASFLFWYLAGLVAAQRMRITAASQKSTTSPYSAAASA